jgi:hypothetical protein
VHTGCELAPSQPLRVVGWPRPPGHCRPDRRERGKRWSHLSIEGAGKLDRNSAYPPPILDRPGGHPPRPSTGAPKIPKTNFGRLHESKIVSLSCDAAVSYRAPLALVGMSAVAGRSEFIDARQTRMTRRHFANSMDTPRFRRIDLLHYYAGSERPHGRRRPAGAMSCPATKRNLDLAVNCGYF